MHQWQFELTRRGDEEYKVVTTQRLQIYCRLSSAKCPSCTLWNIVLLLFAIRTISNEWEFHFSCAPSRIIFFPIKYLLSRKIPRRDRKALNEIACKGITQNFHFAREVKIVLICGLVNNLLQHHYQRWKLIGKAEH